MQGVGCHRRERVTCVLPYGATCPRRVHHLCANACLEPALGNYPAKFVAAADPGAGICTRKVVAREINSSGVRWSLLTLAGAAANAPTRSRGGPVQAARADDAHARCGERSISALAEHRTLTGVSLAWQCRLTRAELSVERRSQRTAPLLYCRLCGVASRSSCVACCSHLLHHPCVEECETDGCGLRGRKADV